MKNKQSIPCSVINTHNEEIALLNISSLIPYEDQPFKVLLDESMTELVQSINERGILTPIVVRPHTDGGYEILSGHRRVKACEIAGKNKIPAVIRDFDDDMAAIFLVDSNIQRDNILPSEKAYAYRLKLEAMKRQGCRTDLTSAQIGRKSGVESRELLAEQVGESRNQISRYIRLTNLIDRLLDKVDEKKIPVNAAVELSYLGTKAQADIVEIMEYDEVSVSLKQAEKIRKNSKEGKIPIEEIARILNEDETKKVSFTLKNDKIRKYFPEGYSKKQIEEIVISLLEEWVKKKE